MSKIIGKLGTCISTAQIAELLGLDVKTVRKYYRELGGIRIGRRYKFFEEEVYNAVQERRIEEQQEENCLDRAGDGRRGRGKKSASRQKKRRKRGK